MVIIFIHPDNLLNVFGKCLIFLGIYSRIVGENSTESGLYV